MSAGLYEGAGSFSQTWWRAKSSSSGQGLSYTQKLDFGNQDGVKGGMTVRF